MLSTVHTPLGDALASLVLHFPSLKLLAVPLLGFVLGALAWLSWRALRDPIRVWTSPTRSSPALALVRRPEPRSPVGRLRESDALPSSPRVLRPDARRLEAAARLEG